MPTETQTRIEQLEAQVKALKEEERKEKEAVRAAFQIQYLFTIKPQDPKRTWSEMYDDSCCFYRIEGRCSNLEECKAVGIPDFHTDSGGMQYVFNRGTGKIVCNTGGGRVWISGEGAQETMDKISAFLVCFPEGGDISEIVNEHRASH